MPGDPEWAPETWSNVGSDEQSNPDTDHSDDPDGETQGGAEQTGGALAVAEQLAPDQ